MKSFQRPTMKDKISTLCHHKNPFINKLYDLVENNREPEVVSWNGQGTAFIVNNREVFSNQILPSLFSHKNLSSFTRQLNMYDFKRCKAPRGKLSYSHPSFKRGRSDLLRNIKRNRKTSKNLEMSMVQEPGPSYEDLIKSNEELKEKQTELENKLKLSYRFISSLLRNNNEGVPSFGKITELYNDAEVPYVESDDTDVPSQSHSHSQLDQHDDDEDEEFEVPEPSPRKMLFRTNERCRPLTFNKIEEKSPGIIEYRNVNFPCVPDISPLNFNLLNQHESIKQEDPESWDSVINEIMLSSNLN